MSTDQKTKQFDGHDLIVPIYLDDSRLLDVFAALEDGFSLVAKVTTHDTNNEGTERDIKGGMGVSGLLSNFIKIDMDVSRTQKRGTESGQQRETERYHTAGSLLQRFRSALLEKGALHIIGSDESSWQGIVPSDFVEVRGIFRPHPVIEGLHTTLNFLDFMRFAQEMSAAGSTSNAPVPNPAPNRQARRNQRPGNPPALANETADEPPSYAIIRTLANKLLADIERKDAQSHLFVLELPGCPLRIIATLFDKYLRDPTMAELLHGNFILFGKVTQNLTGQESFDLLHGTNLGAIPEQSSTGLMDIFNKQASQMMRLPAMTTKITAPALQVVPIAIYV